MSPRRTVRLLVTLALLAGCTSPADRDPTGPGPASPASAALAASNTWAVKHSVSPWRFASAVAGVGGKLYLIGGFRRINPIARVDAYDIATNTWSEVASLPAARFALGGAAVIEGKIYLAGGRDLDRAFTKTLYVYDPATNSWSRKADLPQPVCGGAPHGVIGGKLYVYTACYASRVSGGVFFRYDPATNTWTRRPAPPVDHFGGSGTAVGGKFYLVQGSTFTNCPGCQYPEPTGELDAYDPATNAWSVRKGIGTIPSASAAAALGGKLYLAGGHHIEFQTDTLLIYDPAANRWASGAHLPNYVEAGAAVGYNGRLYYVTGIENMQSPCCFYGPSRLWVYTP